MRNTSYIAILIWSFITLESSAHTLYSASDPLLIDRDEATRSVKSADVTLTMDEAIALGMRDNPDIQSAYLQRITQKFDLRVAEDSFTPKMTISGVYLSGSNEDSKYSEKSIGPRATLLTPYGTRLSLGWAYQDRRSGSREMYRNDGINFELIQPLLRNAGKDVTTAPRELARMIEAQNKLSLKATIAHKITQIVIVYREFLGAQETILIAKKSLERARELMQVNQALIEAGRMAEFEIVQAEADVANQELALEESKNNLEKSRLALLQLLSLDLNSRIKLSALPEPDYVKINTIKTMQIAKNTQPDYLRQLIENNIADVNALLAKNGQLWDLSLVAGASQVTSRSEGFGANKTWDKYVGVQVEIPIGDISTKREDVNAQVIQRIKKIETYEMDQKLSQDILEGIYTINTRWKQYEIAKHAYDLTLRKVNIEREKLLVGRSTNFQVISYENDLRNAGNSRLNASINYQNSLTEMDELTGTTLQSWGVNLKIRE